MKFKLGNLFWNKKTQRIHLDYASTTPVHPNVLAEMSPYWNREWANPSARYKEGVRARTAIESSRKELARILHVRPSDITFTSGGTEANNLAVFGVVEALRGEGRKYEEMEIISTRIEHPSVLETLACIEKRGVKILYAPVNGEGVLLFEEFEKLLNDQTVLVTFAYANSEIGVVQDVKKISRAVKTFNASHDAHIYVHVDASQAPLWLPCMLDGLGADLMTLDAGKCYGPKGAGALVHRCWVKLSPIMYGGGQEQGLRSGTENPALIIGCVYAIARAQNQYEGRSRRILALRDAGFAFIQKEIEGVIINGSVKKRIANNINFSIPGFDTEYAAMWLDARGIAVSTKSACGSGEESGSAVVREMTKDGVRANSTLRITLGEESIARDIETMVSELKKHIQIMKKP
jgi:cysteine desulfurase